jgi:hypothetical protein
MGSLVAAAVVQVIGTDLPEDTWAHLRAHCADQKGSDKEWAK